MQLITPQCKFDCNPSTLDERIDNSYAATIFFVRSKDEKTGTHSVPGKWCVKFTYDGKAA
jgi:hypothetical protein